MQDRRGERTMFRYRSGWSRFKLETLLILLIVFGCIVSIPITAILTHHKRTMASILSSQRVQSTDSEAVARLSKELAELRQLVTEQAIVLDDLSMMHRRLLERATESDSVRQRLSS